MDRTTEALLSFLEEAVTPFHAADRLIRTLEADGYTRLRENLPWDLAPGGRYFLSRNGSSVLAFSVPEGPFRGFQIAAAHTDSPSFKIKEQPDRVMARYRGAETEPYGGSVYSTWMDRPLFVGGRVCVRTGEGVETRLVRSDRPLFLIPSVAIHMNRSCNEKASFNAATDLQPLYGLADDEPFSGKIAELAGAPKESVLSHDLFLFPGGGTVWGAGDQFVSAPRLDDLQCVFALFSAFREAQPKDSVPVFCAFDNEEVGSHSKQGAASDFLRTALERICESLSLSRNETAARFADSFLVSADNAHAVHPNHPEYADPLNAPVLNGGVVIKFNAAQKYTTDAESCALFRRFCEQADVPVQCYANRSDLPGGSTLGGISSSQVSVRSVDIGLPQLAMHSAYETAGAKDTDALVRVMKCFFSASLETGPSGIRIRF